MDYRTLRIWPVLAVSFALPATPVGAQEDDPVAKPKQDDSAIVSCLVVTDAPLEIVAPSSVEAREPDPEPQDESIEDLPRSFTMAEWMGLLSKSALTLEQKAEIGSIGREFEADLQAYRNALFKAARLQRQAAERADSDETPRDGDVENLEITLELPRPVAEVYQCRIWTLLTDRQRNVVRRELARLRARRLPPLGPRRAYGDFHEYNEMNPRLSRRLTYRHYLRTARP